MQSLRRGILAALGLSLSGALFAAPSPGLAEIIERFDHLTVGDAVSVNNLHLTAGHLDCVLAGRAAPVRAGEEVVGIFFEGTGTMDYLSVDPVEAPSVMFNAKNGSSLKPEKTEKGVRLRSRFERILWIAQGQPLPALSGSPASPVAAAFAKRWEQLRRLRVSPISHTFVIQGLDAPEAPAVWAAHGRRRRGAALPVRRTVNPWEGLAAMRSSESSDPEMRKDLFLRHALRPADRPRPPRSASAARSSSPTSTWI